MINTLKETDRVSKTRKLEARRGAETAGRERLPRPVAAGVRIRKLRLALGYARPAFADAIGVTTSAMRGWELEGVEPSLRAINSICRAFAVNRDWLLVGVGRPFPKMASAARNAKLCPNSRFLKDETAPFDARTRARTRRFVATLTPMQRGRALLFYTDLVAALASEDVAETNCGAAN